MAYVYRHIRLDKNEPFYIGIGNDSYGKYKRAFDINRKNSRIWNSIVNKTKYEVEIMIDDISWSDACKTEQYFIDLYGRIDKKTGILANMTNGGEGVIGIILSPERIKQISMQKTGVIPTVESNLKRSIALKGHLVSEETRKKISQKNKGRKLSEELKNHLSRINKGKKIPQIVIDKIKKTKSERTYIFIGRVKSEEEKKKISDYQKGKKWRLGAVDSEETKQKKRDSTKTKKQVLKYSLDGLLLNEYGSQKEAAEKSGDGFRKEDIGRACRGICGYKKNIYKGFVWKHKN